MFLIKWKRPSENHREAIPPAPDGAPSAEEEFAAAEARANAAQAPKAIKEPIIEPEPPHASNGKSE